MNKFFVDSSQINENIVQILNDDVNHIKNVLRLSKGDEICICNKQTGENFICEIINE